MPRDPDLTRSRPAEHLTDTFDAGVAAAFGPEFTPGGWSQPPLLRDDPSDGSPIVQPASPEMPRGGGNRYHLRGEIARGGMGVILKGHDPDLGRDLAFKVLRSDLAGKAGAVQRFVEEAQVGGQLQHPGIIPIHDLGRCADGRPFFAMKLVKGRTLADLLAERSAGGRFGSSRGRFLQFFQKVCEAIAYAHSKGVIHRDLKPSNVMVGSFGEVLVMDWGLAKVLPRGGVADELKASQTNGRRPAVPVEEEPTEIKTARLGSGSETAAGSVMGTPSYMPPEQAGGELDKVDERADVFGLGAILCVVLTGDPPYRGETAEAVRLLAVRGQLADAFARLDECGADDELTSLCKRCLCPEREGRPRDAGELAAAVGAYLASVEQRAHQAELERAAAEVRGREERKRRRVQLALFGAVGLLLLGGGAFAWWQDKQATAKRIEVANREARTAATVTAALEDARSRIEEAWKLTDEPGRLRPATDLALGAVRRAEGFAAAGEPTPDLRQELAAVRQSADDLERHTRLIVVVEQIICEKDEMRYGPAALGSSHRRFTEAFRAFGLDPTAGSADEVARGIGTNRIRNKLLGYLSTWHFRANQATAAETAHLAAVMRAVKRDAGGFLARWQEVMDRNDVPALIDLSASPEALSFGAENVVAIGRHLKAANQNRALVELLRRGCDRYPTNVWLHFDLSAACWRHDPELSAEALRHDAITVFLDPANPGFWVNLGLAYGKLHQFDQAIVANRKAIELNPLNAVAHNNLGVGLERTGDLDGAIASFRRSLSIDPSSRLHQNNLDNAIRLKAERDAREGRIAPPPHEVKR